MAEKRVLSSIANTLCVAAPLVLAVSVSACSEGQNPLKQMAAKIQQNKAIAEQNTLAARRDALASLKNEQSKQQAISTPSMRQTKRTDGKFRADADRMMQRDTVGKAAQLQPPQIQLAATQPKPQIVQQTLIEAIMEKKAIADRRLQNMRTKQARKNSKVSVSIPSKSHNLAVPTPKPTNKSAISNAELLQKPNARKVAVSKMAAPKSNVPLAAFRAKLAALKRGERSEPVTILHIGDSHVASDSFSQGIRRALQVQFGDAGRGMVIPAGAYKYGFADQIDMSRSGKWRSTTALKNKRAAFGISGVRVTTASPGSKLKLKSRTGGFDVIEATVSVGPRMGRFKLKAGDKSKTFNARASKRGTKVFRLEASGHSAVLEAVAGRTTVHNWGANKKTPGIRYANFGLIGATLNITKRFDMALVENDIRTLAPDLIIYGFGTNEGFNDNLNIKSYRAYAEKFLDTMQAQAPDSEVVIIGAADGLRRQRRGGKSCPGGWYVPKKMQPLRNAMKQMANDRRAGYWDWSAAMGGPCSANRWAKRGLAAKDRVHLTSKGYRRSAANFASWLVGSDELKIAAK